MRAIYKAKPDLFLEAIQPLQPLFEIRGEYAGIHILLTSRTGIPEETLIARAEAAGVKVYGLSGYFIHPEHNRRPGTIVLGYACLSEEEILRGAGLLKECFLGKPVGGDADLVR